MAPALTKVLLTMLQPASAVVKDVFRKTFAPEVAKLLRDDESLAQFHDWLSDEALAAEVRARRRAAFAEIAVGCGLLREHSDFEVRLDAGEKAMPLLAEVLDATPEALKTLLKREPAAFSSFEKGAAARPRQAHSGDTRDRSAALRFRPRNTEARELAKQEIKPILRLLLPNMASVPKRLFGAPPTVEELELKAWFNGEPAPTPSRPKRPWEAPEPKISPLLRPPSTEAPEISQRKVVKLAPARLDGVAESLNDYRVQPTGVALPKNISKTRFLVADVETTGLSDQDRVVEIAVLELLGTKETGTLFHSYVNPGRR